MNAEQKVGAVQLSARLLSFGTVKNGGVTTGFSGDITLKQLC
jgi:hypothetical protein